MTERLPDDPAGEGSYFASDEPAALAMGVMDVFCEGAEIVVVRKHEDHYHLYGLRDDDEPTCEVGMPADEEEP